MKSCRIILTREGEHTSLEIVERYPGYPEHSWINESFSHITIQFKDSEPIDWERLTKKGE